MSTLYHLSKIEVLSSTMIYVFALFIFSVVVSLYNISTCCYNMSN